MFGASAKKLQVTNPSLSPEFEGFWKQTSAAKHRWVAGLLLSRGLAAFPRSTWYFGGQADSLRGSCSSSKERTGLTGPSPHKEGETVQRFSSVFSCHPKKVNLRVAKLQEWAGTPELCRKMVLSGRRSNSSWEVGGALWLLQISVHSAKFESALRPDNISGLW